MDDIATMPTRHRLSVRDYDRMVDAGILTKYDRIELVAGEIMDMAPDSQDHEATVNGLAHTLTFALGDKGIVSIRNSIRLDRWSAPQPDAAVFRRRADFYRTGTRPGPADALLLIEVADTSLRYDRTVKLALYATAGITEYWIVNLNDRVLDAYRRPESGTYAEHVAYGPRDRIALSADPEIVVALDLVFG